MKKAIVALAFAVASLASSSSARIGSMGGMRSGHYVTSPAPTRILSDGSEVSARWHTEDLLIIDGPGNITTGNKGLYGRLVTAGEDMDLEELTKTYLFCTGQDTTADAVAKAYSRAKKAEGYDPNNCGCWWSGSMYSYRNGNVVQSKMDFAPLKLSHVDQLIPADGTVFFSEPDTTKSYFVNDLWLSNL